MAIVTTSREAGKQTRQLAREIAKKHSCLFVSRGKSSLYNIVEKARFAGEKAILVVTEEQSKPSFFQLILVTPTGFSYSSKTTSLPGIENFL